jgi:site-specific DNA-methyltransferase (adenine-specific)
MKPYYESGGITIYNGDCRDILPALSPVDLLLTDPPYGIAKVWKGGFSSKHGWGRAGAEAMARNEWDAAPPNEATLLSLIGLSKHQIIWGGNYFPLPPSRGWLVWNKPERNFTLAEAELAWTNIDTVIRVFDFRRSDVGRVHPTQKPLELMQWSITRAPESETILDPFMGSGTTLRAAKDLGKRAIGIELEERWCEVAVRRLAQEVLF